MDGGNSFKRVAAAGRCDERSFNSRFFLDCEELDKYRKGVPASTAALATEKADLKSLGFIPEADETSEEARCGTTWFAANGKELKSGLFEHTGSFATLCRHGRPELMIEMIRCGEL
jgi:hypothetical protein